MRNKRIVARRRTVGGGAALNRWFEERRMEMTGKCRNCGGQTTVYSDIYFKFSIAHILPKAYFKSVEAHPLNWIELCHFGNSCHDNMDRKTLDLTEMNCWDEIVEKFLAIYPSIDPKERRRIPPMLMEYVKTQTDI